MSNGRSRTAQEREAARRERELRRGARYGATPDPAPDPVSDPAYGATPAPVPDPVPDPAYALDPFPDPVHDPVQPPAPLSPAARERGEVSDPGDEGPPDQRSPALTDGARSAGIDAAEREIPSGTRRAARTPRGARTARRPPTSRGARVGRPRQHSRVGRLLAGLALVLAAAVIWFLVELFQPFHGSGQGSVTVTIPAHTSSSSVGSLLERDGVVSSGFFFELRALLDGERSSLRAGTYHLQRDMSYGAALAVLTTAPPAAKVSDLTIIEGKARSQVAALLRAQRIGASYLAATRRSPLLDPRRYGAPRTTSTLEGFLFPSTYQLRDPISIQALVDDQLLAFRQRFARVDLSYARSQRLSAYDILIVASLVQGEAQTARDRPLVASVIYNRLRARMLLQIDATVRYATGNYTTPITVSQLASRSPFNTYLHAGLPPAPIDSPGLAAIEAAAHPASTNYLYFVVKPCGNGESAFASNYSQFLAEVNQYRIARAKRGGRSPARC